PSPARRSHRRFFRIGTSPYTDSGGWHPRPMSLASKTSTKAPSPLAPKRASSAGLAEQRNQTGPEQRHRPEQVDIEPGPTEERDPKALVDDDCHETHDDKERHGVQRRRRQSLPRRKGRRIRDQSHVLVAAASRRQPKQDGDEHQSGAVSRRHQEGP